MVKITKSIIWKEYKELVPKKLRNISWKTNKYEMERELDRIKSRKTIKSRKIIKIKKNNKKIVKYKNIIENTFIDDFNIWIIIEYFLPEKDVLNDKRYRNRYIPHNKIYRKIYGGYYKNEIEVYIPYILDIIYPYIEKNNLLCNKINYNPSIPYNYYTFFVNNYQLDIIFYEYRINTIINRKNIELLKKLEQHLITEFKIFKIRKFLNY